jgi:hypothetical protein
MKRLLRILFVTNFRNKLTALVLAVVIWLVVSLEVTSKYERGDVAVEIMPVQDGVVMTDIAVEPAHVTVKARFIAPKRIAQQYLGPGAEVRAVHRLDNPRIGELIPIRLTREDFDLPYDVQLDSIEPRRLNIVLRRIISRKLQVKVDLRGRPAAGYELAGEPEIEPTEVTVRGPKETIELADHILTEPVDTEGRSASFSSDYSLVNTVGGKPVETSTKVRVRVNIRPAEVVHSFVIPVRFNTPIGYDYEILLPKLGEAGKVEVPIKGPQFVLDDPGTAAKISAFVVITGDMSPRPGIYYSAKLQLLLPPELAELKLAGEHFVDLEIREREKEEPKDTEGK